MRVVLIALTVSIALVAAGQAVQSLVILPAFEHIEVGLAGQNAGRCVAALEELVAAASRTCHDYARWDDTYSYVETADPEYADSNLGADTFSGNTVDLVMVVDVAGRVVWGGACPDGGETVEPLKRIAGLPEAAWSALLQAGPEGRQGMERTDAGLLLVAAWPITTSEGEGPARGVVIMGRWLDRELEAELSKRTRVRFALHDADPSAPPIGTESQPFVELMPGQDDRLLASATCNGLTGAPLVVVAAELPRAVSQAGRHAARIALISLAAASIVGLLFTVGFIQSVVVRPVERLGAEVREVGASAGLAARVTEQGTPELAHLARDINGMLGSLERADRGLRESEARQRAAFQNAAVGFVLTEPNGSIVQANQRWADMLGTDVASLVGRRIDQIVHPEDVDEFRECVQAVADRKSESFRIEVRCVRSDGEAMWGDLAGGAVRSPEGALEAVVLVMADTSDRKRAEEELESMSRRDGLTGLANRRAFEERLELEWRRAVRNKGQVALLLLDVDHFKSYNDTYGHLAGDECLAGVARIVRDGCRHAVDLPCRWGGEEFTVVLADTGLPQALCCAERVRAMVEEARLPRDGQTPDYVTVSVGVAVAEPSGSGDKGMLVAAADKAMYEAKHAGRNRVAATVVDAEGQAHPTGSA